MVEPLLRASAPGPAGSPARRSAGPPACVAEPAPACDGRSGPFPAPARPHSLPPGRIDLRRTPSPRPATAKKLAGPPVASVDLLPAARPVPVAQAGIRRRCAALRSGARAVARVLDHLAVQGALATVAVVGLARILHAHEHALLVYMPLSAGLLASCAVGLWSARRFQRRRGHSRAQPVLDSISLTERAGLEAIAYLGNLALETRAGTALDLFVECAHDVAAGMWSHQWRTEWLAACSAAGVIELRDVAVPGRTGLAARVGTRVYLSDAGRAAVRQLQADGVPLAGLGCPAA